MMNLRGRGARRQPTLLSLTCRALRHAALSAVLLLAGCPGNATDNRPPDPPEIGSCPSVLGIAVRCSLGVRAADPDGDSVALRVDWGDGDTSGWTAFAAAGDWQTLDHAWSDSGTYDIRAMAKDVRASLSPWSPPRRVVVAAPGTKLWTFPLVYSGQNRTSAVIGEDGTIYAGGDSLFAVSPDGERLWGFPGPVTSTPAVGDDGTIYFASGSDQQDDFVVAVDRHGSERWRFRVPDFVCSSPALGSDGKVYFGSEDTRVYALTADGRLSWSFATGWLVQAAPSIAADGTVYIGSGDSNLYALGTDGGLKWPFKTGGWVGSSVALADDGTLYFGSDDGKVYALNPDGRLLWEFATGRMVASSPAIGPGRTVYVGSNDCSLYALDGSGGIKWRCSLDNYVWSSPAVGADGVVYVASLVAGLHAIDSLGSILWVSGSCACGFSSPVLTDDARVLVVGDDDSLHCLLATAPPAASAWPMFKRNARRTGRQQ